MARRKQHVSDETERLFALVGGGGPRMLFDAESLLTWYQGEHGTSDDETDYNEYDRARIVAELDAIKDWTQVAPPGAMLKLQDRSLWFVRVLPETDHRLVTFEPLFEVTVSMMPVERWRPASEASQRRTRKVSPRCDDDD